MQTLNSRLEDGVSSTIVPMLQRLRGANSGDKTVSKTVWRLSLLLGAIVSLALSALTIMFMFQNQSRMSGLIVYFWACVGVSIPLITAVRFIFKFLERQSTVAETSLCDSRICAVEICIDNETVLTVRSWWPIDMTKKEVEKNGVRVAMSSAQRWISDNSHHGGKTSKIRFSMEDAVMLTRRYLTKRSDCSHDQCSVCLDHIGTHGEDHSSSHGMQMLGCGHVFHEECLVAWFSQSSKLSCPMCRTDHHQLVPQSVLMQYCVKEEPNVSVLTVQVVDGIMPNGTEIH